MRQLFWLLLSLPFTGFLSSAQGLKTTSGTHLVTNGPVRFVFRNTGFTNNGTLHAGLGDFIFSGDAITSSSFIAGDGPGAFYRVSLNKTANGLQLNRDIAVSDSLRFVSGDSIFLNTHIIDLGATGAISRETSQRRLTGRTGGYIQSTQVLNAPTAMNPGNLGFRITSTANLGSTQIRRGHQQQSGASVFRYYEITPSLNTGLNAGVDFYYDDNELGSLAEGNLGLFLSSNGNQWTNLGVEVLNQSSNFLSVTGLSSLNRFTLAYISAPLAARLLSFTAENKGTGKVVLSWTVTDETPDDKYILEKSADGIRFAEIYRRDAGVQAGLAQYQHDDIYPFAGRQYYRLRIIYPDGQSVFSSVIWVDAGVDAAGVGKVFPNPLSGHTVSVYCFVEKPGIQWITISDMQGRIVQRSGIYAGKGVQVLQVETGFLKGGMYTIHSEAGLFKASPLLKL
ncbi:MAG: T9SS type A sorting domain-containing protein [Chitinophagaceae bacterium]|nr:T9SS type A sorting domain-containing protein [Chitinophagaceae bacterium]